MPDDPAQSSPASLALTLLVTLAVFTAGCASDDGTPDEDGDPAAGEEECDAQSGTTDRSSGVQVACRNAVGADTHTESFDCPSPEQSAVSVATNMTAGQLTVLLEDDTGTSLFEETYDERGVFNDSRAINDGQQGEWTLEVDRSENFRGGFGVQAACAQ